MTDPVKTYQMDLPADTHLAYIVSHEAWYASAPGNREQRPSVSVSASVPDDGVAWEFQVEQYDFGRHGMAIRLGVFEDAFAAFAQMPEFFAALAAERISTLAGVRALLDRLGAVDETKRESPYAQRAPRLPDPVHGGDVFSRIEASEEVPGA